MELRNQVLRRERFRRGGELSAFPLSTLHMASTIISGIACTIRRMQARGCGHRVERICLLNYTIANFGYGHQLA